MAKDSPSREDLLAENAALKARLEEAEDTLRAIRNGEVDALVVAAPGGEQIFTLKGADHSYRLLVENINEGAATLAPDGAILYANRRFAEIVAKPLEQVIGSNLREHVMPMDRTAFAALLAQGGLGDSRGELYLAAADGSRVPAYLSLSSLKLEEAPGTVALVATDLREQKLNEAIVAEGKLCSEILLQTEQTIIVCDPHGRIIRTSKRALEVCGCNPLFEPFEDQFFFEPAPAPASRNGKPFTISRALKGEVFNGVEVTYQGPERQTFHFLLNAGPLRTEKGKTLGCVVSLTDITEFKQAEAALRKAHEDLQSQQEELQAQNEELLVLQEDLRVQNEELAGQTANMKAERARLSAVLEHMPVGVCIAVAPSGGFLNCNQQMDKIWGRPIPLAGSISDYQHYHGFHPDGRPYRPEEWPLARSITQGEVVFSEEMDILRSDGTRITISVSSAPIRDDRKRIFAAVMAAQDITERKLTETILKWQAWVLENMSEGVIVSDTEGLIISTNPAVDSMFGYQPGELTGQSVLVLNGYPPEESYRINQEVFDQLNATGAWAGEMLKRKKDGTLFYSYCNVKAMELAGQKYFIAVKTDTTQRREAEEALSRAYDGLEHQIMERTAALATANKKLLREEKALLDSERKLRILMSQLLTAQEKERQRISFELHDEMGGALTVLKMQLRSFQKQLPPDWGSLREDFEDTLIYVNDIIENVRRISRDLSPTILEDLGLPGALEYLAKEFEKHFGIRVSFQMAEMKEGFSQEAGIMLYRIMQESLHNIGKHAKATNVIISLTNHPGCVHFNITDDGQGFDLEETEARVAEDKGLGLLTIGERVRILGGSLKIKTSSGGGTQLSFTIPQGF